MNELALVDRANLHRDRVAVEAASQSWSYGQLIDRSASIAAAFLGDNDDLNEARIGFLVPPGCDYISVQWGIWRAGGIAVPLSLSATEKELEYVLTDSRVSRVVATRDEHDLLLAICQRKDLPLSTVDELENGSSGKALPQLEPTRRAMILYTSGTTSKPKGVVTTHACIQAQIESLIEAWRWQPDDCIPMFLPLHHIHGIINVMSCALWSGARIEVFPRFELESILSRVADRAYSLFMAVPTIYVKLIDALVSMPGEQREKVVAGFAAMRLMVSGSAALPASVHEMWTQLTGQQLLERYGMTEIGMALSNPYVGERRPGAVGQPLPGVEVRLQSDAGATISEEDLPGEIQVRGANVFLEYWDRPEATEASFDHGWFRTGDMAVMERGYYRIMGRSSIDIIKSGGYKLSALEIEAALLDHPAISECAVVGLPDSTWGESVAAAVVLKQDEKLDIDDLRSWCKDRISHYKIPRRLLVLDALPRNAMGKVTKPQVVTRFS